MNRYILTAILFAGVISVGFGGISYAQENTIPSWVKSIAGEWANDELTDLEFKEAIKFLIESDIIVIEGYGKIENYTNIDPLPPITLPMELTVQTDKKSYNIGDILKISGTTNDGSLETVTILVIDPLDNVKAITQVSPNDEEYSYNMKITGTMEEIGSYIVRVQQGPEKIETTFLITNK